MRFPRRIACALFLLTALSTAGGEIALPLPDERWLSLKAEGLEIISNASPAVTGEIARDLLTMRAAVRRLTPVEVRPHRPVKVVVFANGRGFTPYRQAISQEKTKFTSVFLHGTEGNFVLLQGDAADRGLTRSARRELTRYFVENTTPALPFWFQKGIVQYYSTFDMTPSHAAVGSPVPFETRLRSQSFVLRELLAPARAELQGNELAVMELFGDPKSWTLVHYLMADQDRRARLGSFLKLVGGGRDAEQAVAEAFGRTYAELEQELRSYVSANRFPPLKVPVSDLGAAIPEAEPLPYGQVLYELGHLLASTKTENAASAGRFLTEALKLDPAHAEAHADLGWLHDRAERPQQAEEEYAKAVQLGSDRASVHVAYGIRILNRLATNFAGMRVSPPELLKAREAFKRATELDPLSARAWTALGISYAQGEGDRAPGIAALERSLQLAPGDPEAASYLAHLYADAGRRADADRIVKTIAPTAPPEVRARARRATLLGAIREAESFASKGHVKSAATLARSVLEHADDEEMKKYAQSLLVRIEEVASTLRLVEERNLAVRHANAGKNEEALAILDRILPEITDPEMREQTQTIRDQVAARISKRKR